MTKNFSHLLKCTILLILFYSSLLFDLKAQTTPPVIQWEKSFGRPDGAGGLAEDWAHNMSKTSEGGYIACGYSESDPSGLHGQIPSIEKIDALGQTIWSNVYPFGYVNQYGKFTKVIEITGGGYVAVGRKRNSAGIDKICLIKTDKDGNSLLETLLTPSVPGIGTGSITSLGDGITEVPGGGFIVSGTADHGSISTIPDAIVIKVDNSFNIVWETRILGAVAGRAFSVCLTYSGGTNPDGSGIGALDGFAVTGVQSNSPTLNDVLVAKVGLSGNIIWQTTVDATSYPSSFYTYNETSPCSSATKNSLDEGRCVIQDKNGDIVVSAEFNKYQTTCALVVGDTPDDYQESDAVLLKFPNDLVGALFLAKNISHFSGGDLSGNIIQTTDNGYAIIGSTADLLVLPAGNENDMLLVKTDGSANVQWRKALSGTEYSCGFGICQSTDGGYVLAGNNADNRDDYQFIKLYNECQQNFTYDQDFTYIVGGDLASQGYYPHDGEIWTGLGSSLASWNIKGEIIVVPGVTFTIQNSYLGFADTRQTNDWDYLAGNVFLPGNSIPTKIIVQQGGKLIIDNSVLKGIHGCGTDYMWQGIEVWGTPTANQTLSNQGKVTLQNHATIQDALTGVLLNQSDFDALGQPTMDVLSDGVNSYGGGILLASHSNFINCLNSVHFAAYPYSLTSAPTLYNSSSIGFCNFENNSAMADPNFVTSDGIRLGNNTFVFMSNKRGVTFAANIFNSTTPFTTATSIFYRGNGIVAYDSKFTVDRACDIISTTTGDCAGAPNLFENLFKAISINSIVGIGGLSVKSTQFTNNKYGVILEGTGAVSVIKNNFDLPKDLHTISSPGGGYFGVYTCSAQNFNIEENTFNSNNSAGIAGDNLGVVNFNSQSIGGNVYRNTYNSIAIADMIGEDNSSLLLDCNNYNVGALFTSTPFQWAVTSGNLHTPQGYCISADPTAPEANIFTGGCSGLGLQLFKDPSALPFTYNSFDAARPTCFTLGITIPASCVSGLPSGACPSTISGGTSTGALFAIITNYNNQIKNLLSQIDGGNTQALLNSINTKPPGQIQSDLLAKSPYLSDQVLLAAINKTSPLPPGTLKNIIIPNSPVTPSVKAALDVISLPNGIRNQINNAQTGVSARSLLEQKISFYQGESQSVTNRLVRYYLDSAQVDSAIVVLKAANNIDALCALIPIQIQKKALVDANTSLTKLTSFADSVELVNPSDSKIPVIRSFCQFHHYVITIQTQPGGYYKMTPVQLQTIKDLAASNLPIAINAQSILKMVYNQDFPRYAEPIRTFHAPIIIDPLDEQPKEMFGKLYPNPNNGNMQFDYLLEQGDLGELIIYNTIGQLVTKYPLTEGTHSLQISEAALENGVYFYQQIINGKPVLSDRLVIIK
jgi:hypothetical protein